MRRVCMLLFILAVSGCNPFFFRVNEERPINAHILSGLNSASHDRTSITLSDSSIVALNRYGVTEFDFTSVLNLIRGKGLRVLMRPVVQQSLVDSGLVLNI